MSSGQANTPGSSRDAPRRLSEISPTGSATDVRNPLHRVESASQLGDGLSQSFQSTETVRRRPEPQSYGTISQQSSSQHRLEPKMSELSQAIEGPQTQGIESPRPSQSMRSPMLGPERGRGGQWSKKPAMSRRASSNLQAPHRGQEFSVDDDVTEIEDAQTRQSAASGYGSVRHQASTTLRRRPTQQTTLSRVDSEQDDETAAGGEPERIGSLGDITREDSTPESGQEGALHGVDDTIENEDDVDDDDALSDTESFTLKDRQEAINETHPFGIRIWKPALYKKRRSVQKTAEGDIHSAPGGRVNRWLLFFNIMWTVCFGWWLGLAAFLGAVVCFIFAAAPSAIAYGRVLWGLAGYLFYPFGKFVRLEQDQAYADEDEGEGRSITEYEQWQSGDIEDGRLFFGPERNRSIVGRSRRSMDSFASETDSLLGRPTRGVLRENSERRLKRRLFGRGEWNIGRVIFFLFFYGLTTPLLFLVSGVCWFLVFSIPMGKVLMLLFSHLRRHPLALSFESDSDYSRGGTIPNSSILVCTYRAVGLKYWKYTIDGTNIFLINLMGVVLFVIFDYWVLDELFGFDLFITSPAFLFVAALFSIIPLAHFIGQAVASISAQSSMGLGAAINAFFSTLVEVFLYCIALNQGKGQLVEGSIIGSIFAGVLFLPGLSMCFGAIKRKTQRFNAKSAGVTSTMLLFAVIAAFGPTLFYQIYGTHELNCLDCIDDYTSSRDCQRCYFSQIPALDDRFYLEAVRPYCWFAATLLFLSYIIGLWFTLRTHAAVIWNVEVDEKRVTESHQVPGLQNTPGDTAHARLQKHGIAHSHLTDSARRSEIRDSQLYKRILGQSLKQVGLGPREEGAAANLETVVPNGSNQTPHLPPPKGDSGDNIALHLPLPSLSEAENKHLVREVAEMAATAATIAARDATRFSRKASTVASTSAHPSHKPQTAIRAAAQADQGDLPVGEAHADTESAGGHDAPNWGRTKSAVILCSATILYALIAEILVNTVDVVLKNVAIDEKFLGITLFALVPNTTEFLNAISFAMNGNIALSMEIGSAYALQVCLLQIPALVFFSAITGQWLEGPDIADRTFTLIFPQWDMVTVILCVFLLSYMYGEGKSNYFKGSILLLSYLVVMVGFWFSSMTDVKTMGMSRFDTMTAGGTYKTIGRRHSGPAFQA